MSNKIGLFPILTILLASIVIISSQSTTVFGQSSPTGLIAFESDRDGNREIYVMNADGTSQTRLTTNTAMDVFSSWSPDGTKILFASTRDGNSEIYVMNADGTSQTRITTNPAQDVYPSWSPDGTKIVFVSLRDDGNREIYVMNADGTSQTRLTTNTASDVNPSWSPDGTKIAFESTRDGNDQIYVMNADGTSQTRISNNLTNDVSPSWSPDRTKIVFISTRDGNNEIYVMNADGTSQTRITTNPAQDVYPSWSPDGTKIVFVSDRDGNNEIYVMNADGTSQTNISNNPAFEVDPVWQPIPPEPQPQPVPVPEIEEKITICHIPPDNPNNPQTIIISKNSWSSHQAHGDTIGACVNPDTTQPKETPQPKPDNSFNFCSELATRSLIGDKQIVVFTDKSSYREGDTAVISGEIKELQRRDWGQYIPIREIYNDIVTMQIFAPNGNLVDIAQIKVGEDHKFCHVFSTGGSSWNFKGTYTIKLSYGTETTSTTFKFPDDFNSLNLPAVSQPQPESLDKKITICHIPPGNPANAHTISIPQSAWSAHQAHGDTRGECQQGTVQEIVGDGHQVIISKGSDSHGCEETHDCFQPYSMKIKQGDEVTWYNYDSSAHTITSGTEADGPDGNFDSSLFMAGTTFSHKFDGYQAGTYPYFCMVHPWMTGEIIVDDVGMKSISNWNENTIPTGMKNTKEQNKPKTIGSLTKQNQQSQSLWSDKSTYVDGSIIHIEGKTKDIQPNSMVNVRVYSPSKYNIADERLFVSDDGKFEIDFDTSDKLWFENGEYVIKVEDLRHNEQNQIKVTVDEPHGEFLASAQEVPIAPAEKSSKDNDKVSDLIEENKKLREELERQGTEIDNLNKQVDYLGEMLDSIRGLFSWAFP